jgi:hypothetical protein
MLPLPVKYWSHYLHAIRHFHDYKPQPVTVETFTRWLQQFDDKDKKAVLLLLSKVIYLSEQEIEQLLVKLNEALLARLEKDAIPAKKVIYVQLHDPGSSSALILNMLRDRARLEQKGCRFIDSKNVRELNEVTAELEQGAIVYVDDFAASGNQFCEVRDYLADYIVGPFAEFFLLPCICEEAIYELGKRGIEALSGPIHSKADRPLHPNCTVLDRVTKNRLIELCSSIDNKAGLGYRGLATMVVLFRNAPNTLPVVLRGSRKRKYAGIFPRTTDLP